MREGSHLRVITAFITAATLALPLPAGAQEAEGTGGIAGIVTEAGSGSSSTAPGSEKPLEGICVHVYEAPKDLRFVGTRTGPDGSYEVDGLEGSSYHVWFRDCRDPSTHLAEWHEDAEMRGDATPVVVVAGETTEVDAALDLGGSISGVVTDEDTGDPVDDVTVYLWGPDGVRWTDTDSDGEYRKPGLREGSYRLFFFDPIWPADYVAEYYDDEDDFDDADPVQVSLGAETAGIDVELAPMVRPDLALEDLVVENVPVETDDAEGPHTGFVRDVTVTATNIGSVAADFMTIEVEVCPQTTGSCRLVVHDPVGELPSGQTLTRTYRWNALETGSLGDVTVRAEAYELDDVNDYNDTAEALHYVLVGGTGFGAGP